MLGCLTPGGCSLGRTLGLGGRLGRVLGRLGRVLGCSCSGRVPALDSSGSPHKSVPDPRAASLARELPGRIRDTFIGNRVRSFKKHL